MKLVIIAGAGCDKGMYKPTIPTFLNTFDSVDILLAIGDSLDEASKDVKRQLDLIKEEFLLLGHCYGGLVCINLFGGMKYSNKLMQGFVLCNSHYNFTRLNLDSPKKGHETHNDYIKEGYNLEENFKHLLGSEITNNQLNMVINNNIEDAYNNIKITMLVIASDKDGYLSLTDYEELKARLKGTKSEYVVIDNTKHLGILTDTKKYADAIERFMMEKLNYDICISNAM